MRTIRLADPGGPPVRPTWGSSAWAADSCLAEWSQFERDWLGPDPRERPQRQRKSAPREPLSPLAAACAVVAIGAVAFVVRSVIALL